MFECIFLLGTKKFLFFIIIGFRLSSMPDSRRVPDRSTTDTAYAQSYVLYAAYAYAYVYVYAAFVYFYAAHAVSALHAV